MKNAEEEAALGGGWADTSAGFNPYKGARPARTDEQDPVKWVDDWTVPGLSSDHRKKIKARLLRADAAFWKSPAADSADLTSMKLAFDGAANVLFEAGVLTEQLLQDEIPVLVWDSSIAGGWYRFASETPENIFPERLGHYYVWRDEGTDWNALFRTEHAKWLAELLEASPPTKSLPRPPKQSRPRKRDPQTQKIKEQVRQLRGEGLSDNDICSRLADNLRPPRAVWRELTWPIAYQRHTAAVAKWLSEACR